MPTSPRPYVSLLLPFAFWLLCHHVSWRCDHPTIQSAFITTLILSVHYILMKHLFGRGLPPWHFSQAKRNCLTPINTRQHVHATVFTSTRGYVDRNKMILSWVRQPEAFVLREGNKCCLPRNRLLSGDVSSNKGIQFTWGNAHIRKENGRRNRIVELPSKRVGRFGSEA